ncbi:Bug family tripartite tricarboxylate transporter substrate binding protein [Psychrobacter aestuarii]|uniref:Tripartite tricarboxylate transporter substrate binding protein n=1 Tax=Psychrobacter aestuarii TaxID=556327 RepID=A0ABP3F6N1_9GAMM|nr:tripartite tricarboxylate transporter substrate-binding protein [Psychrobacter aestuarii]
MAITLSPTVSQMWSKSVKIMAVSAISMLAVACGQEDKAAAGDAAVDFKGENIEFIVPYNAGGGTDKWARFYAPLLSKNLPGEPNIIIKNMPGGGSTKGSNFFTQRATKDGMMILASSASSQIPFLLGDKRVEYNYEDWQAVVASPTDGVVYVSADTGIKNVADLVKTDPSKLVFGSQGPTSMDLVPLLALDLLGVKPQTVFGMKGKKDTRLALMRGETNLDFQSSSAYLTDVVPDVESGKAIPLFVFGTLDEQGNLQRDPTFPDLPHFGEVYKQIKGEDLSGEAYETWKKIFVASFPAQKMIVLPKGTPDNVVAAYNDAMQKVISDPGFEAASKEELGDYKQIVGAEADEIKTEATKFSDDSRKWIQDWLRTNYQVTEFD